MFIFSRNKELFAKLEEYLGLALKTVEVFNEAVEYFVAHGVDEHFCVMAKKTQQNEAAADDIRREIETFMYEKSLLPETREDLLIIIETIDKIPNHAEAIVNIFQDQKTKLFPQISGMILELLAVSRETFGQTVEATRNCFGKRDMVKAFNAMVDKNENLGDDLERKMISNIFSSDLNTGDKILQKEIVVNLGEICDLCKTTLDHLMICSVKRQL
ncbi:MAG: hypothetical protein A2017_06035 [Lentisphaerae bacterium GWF2_44_16]|nr:MAG: hypothetical protein A2017_06035 [Lentisphaerae bacterium GWF2_44_16]